MFETKLATEVLVGDQIRYRGNWWVILTAERIMDRVVFVARNAERSAGLTTIDLAETDYPGWWRYSG